MILPPKFVFIADFPGAALCRMLLAGPSNPVSLLPSPVYSLFLRNIEKNKSRPRFPGAAALFLCIPYYFSFPMSINIGRNERNPKKDHKSPFLFLIFEDIMEQKKQEGI